MTLLEELSSLEHSMSTGRTTLGRLTTESLPFPPVSDTHKPSIFSNLCANIFSSVFHVSPKTSTLSTRASSSSPSCLPKAEHLVLFPPCSTLWTPGVLHSLFLCRSSAATSDYFHFMSWNFRRRIMTRSENSAIYRHIINGLPPWQIPLLKFSTKCLPSKCNHQQNSSHLLLQHPKLSPFSWQILLIFSHHNCSPCLYASASFISTSQLSTFRQPSHEYNRP